jgi:hypothetical protein
VNSSLGTGTTQENGSDSVSFTELKEDEVKMKLYFV